MEQKKLFTPGPLGVSLSTKQAMLVDLASRDIEFMKMLEFIRGRLLQIAGVSSNEYTCVPLQGSGMFAIEAVFTTSIPRSNAKVLVIENGAYGRRFSSILNVLGVEAEYLSFSEDEKVDPIKVEDCLRNNNNEASGWTNIFIVHCETSSGVINPIEDIGRLITKYAPDASYFVDAMSSFGAMDINMEASHIDFLVSSANKCLEGVPGFSYALCRNDKLLKCKGWSRSLCLDLVAQWESLETTGQFRFTPPTHSMLAFQQALKELEVEGGPVVRANRYKENNRIIFKGMRELGFKPLLDDTHNGYIITSFKFPQHKNFVFQTFYTGLQAKNQVIYPGKVTKTDCFRIGNIGHLFPRDMRHLLNCVEQVCIEMGMSLPLQ